MPSEKQRLWIAKTFGIAPLHEGGEVFSRLQHVRDLAGGVTEDLAVLTRVDPERAAGLQHAMRVALAQGEAGDPEGAAAALEEIAEFVAAIHSGQRMDMMADDTTKGLVAERVEAFEAARAAWQHGVDAATAAVQPVLNDLHTVAPEDAKGLQTILDSYWADLDDLIEQAATDGSSQRVAETFPALLAEITASATFNELDAQGCLARAALLASIDQIRAALST
jgi:hypothetical protein